MGLYRHASRLALVGLVLVHAISRPQAREITFEERVAAQAAIESVHYAHQIGRIASFEEAVPRAVLEEKVRRYLGESSALEGIGNVRITAEMLANETRRMARRTRMPGRLRELFGALGNDGFLIEECLARPALVERLFRERIELDPRIHAGARREAEALRDGIVPGSIDGRLQNVAAPDAARAATTWSGETSRT